MGYDLNILKEQGMYSTFDFLSHYSFSSLGSITGNSSDLSLQTVVTLHVPLSNRLSYF